MYFVRIACNQFGNNGLNASADYMKCNDLKEAKSSWAKKMLSLKRIIATKKL